MQKFDEFIGSTLTTRNGGLLTVCSSLPRVANKSIEYVFECSICSKDKELWPIGSITGTKRNAQVQSVCGCSPCPAYTYQQQYIRAKRLAEDRGYDFSGFSGAFYGSKTRIILNCRDHGEWRTTDINHFLMGRGCPRCARVNLEKLTHPTREQVELRVQAACDNEGIKFSRWVDDTRKSNSRIALMCEKHGEYIKNLSKFLYSKERCQSCVRNGFNRTIDGFLYLLESECGWFYKIGITNHPKQRFTQLRRATPFKFSVEELLPMHGAKAHQIEIDAHKRFQSANMEGFDGCTEWIMKNISVSDYIKERAN